MESLQEQVKRQEQELKEAKQALQNREIQINEAGSIAEAALQLNGIFEWRKLPANSISTTFKSSTTAKRPCARSRQKKAAKKPNALLEETAQKCKEQEEACRRRCEEMEAEAKRRAAAYWADVSRRLQIIYKDYQKHSKYSSKL